METLAFLGRTLGFSFAAGINLYATVALVGLASRFGWVQLPPEYTVFANPWIIGAALLLYVIEFFADKIPWVDTLWDGLHTFIRPVGGALMAATDELAARDDRTMVFRLKKPFALLPSALAKTPTTLRPAKPRPLMTAADHTVPPSFWTLKK